MRGKRREGRENNPYHPFTYPVTLCDPIPQRIIGRDENGDITSDITIEAGREMQRLWNLACEEYEKLLDASNALIQQTRETDCCTREEAKAKTKEERKEIFHRLYFKVYPKLAASWLPSTFYKFLWKKLQTTTENFAKGIGGPPRPHFRMEKIILPHVDASGGKPVAYLPEVGKRKPYLLRDAAPQDIHEWRRVAHRVFDPLWKSGQNDAMSRDTAYQWLAAQMGIPIEQAHISKMDIEQCKTLIQLTLIERNRRRAERRHWDPREPSKELVAKDFLRRGFITINDTRIWFDAVIHRPLPENALIKQFALVGRLVKPFGWEWELQITAEMSQKPEPDSLDAGKWIAIDFGWRTRESGVRVAYWRDYKGDCGEFLMPYRCENRFTRDRANLEKKFRSFGRDFQPDITDIRDYWERQSRADEYLERVKNQLRECDRSNWAEEIQEQFAPRLYHVYKRPDGAEFKRNSKYSDETLAKPKFKGYEYLGERAFDSIEMMRSGRLVNLCRALGDLAPDFLRRWMEESALEFRRMRGARIRIERFRNDRYRNWAVKLARDYDCLFYEGNLDLKGIAEADTHYAIAASQKYRQEIASPHTLKSYILETFKRERKLTVPREAAGTTSTCAVCGANIERRPALVLECENGHLQDQDFTAVSNLSDPNWPTVRPKGRKRVIKKELADSR